MTENDWLTAATADSAVAAELLLNLRRATAQPPPNRRTPPPNWTVHQRRSRTLPLIPESTKPEASTASPSTPLSWSGGASVSGGGGAPVADGVDSTRSNRCCLDVSRSEVTPSRETASMRARKKKTLAALKLEEDALMEEQDHLKRKLAELQANCEKLIKENARLKKIKMDIRVEAQGERPEAISSDHLEMVNEPNNRVVLPDLNVPFEDVLSY